MTINQDFIASEIFGLESQYWRALKNNDIDTMLELTDEECIVTGSQGVHKFGKKDFAAMLKSPNYKLIDYELNPDYQVRVLNENTAVIAYKVKEDLSVDGKPVSFEASDSSTWIRRDGKWVCSVHTESITGDPFGRDRYQADAE